MKRSRERILTTHTGRLPRPDDVAQMLFARERKLPYDEGNYDQRIREAVVEVVAKQVEAGVDVVSDGEESKPNFSSYVRERLGGIEEWQQAPKRRRGSIFGREMADFGEYFRSRISVSQDPGPGSRHVGVVAPLVFTGYDQVRADAAALRTALSGHDVEEAFLPSVSPGSVEHWLWNEYYPDDEAFLTAIAIAMHEEYRTIVDEGFLVQIDDPDLADAWQMHPEMDVEVYRRHAALRIEALNYALAGIPEDRVRYHLCWGAYRGPHKHDIALGDIVDLMLKVKAQAYSVEASNARHAHEWRIWEDVKLPDGKMLLPGVVGHCSDWIEHPELVSERIVKFARLVGRENVLASTDCGLGNKVHPQLAWAKLKAQREGADLATKVLWKR
jgi:5-methyltetrahydropteroyltriglutamate--homocysteine methyltransferase